KRPLIVAPTHLKFVQTSDGKRDTSGYLDNAPGMKVIWECMEREMREAKALVFIGYSFPVADLYFSSILRSVLADRDGAPVIVLVNPDAVAIGKNLQERFALNQIDRYYDIQTFVNGSRDQLLKHALNK